MPPESPRQRDHASLLPAEPVAQMQIGRSNTTVIGAEPKNPACARIDLAEQAEHHDSPTRDRNVVRLHQGVRIIAVDRIEAATPPEIAAAMTAADAAAAAVFGRATTRHRLLSLGALMLFRHGVRRRSCPDTRTRQHKRKTVLVGTEM